MICTAVKPMSSTMICTLHSLRTCAIQTLLLLAMQYRVRILVALRDPTMDRS